MIAALDPLAALPAVHFPSFPSDDILSSLTPTQREAALATGPVLALAGAGTGKTTTLTASIALRIIAGVAPRNILAVTFTNKTARQLRVRLTDVLGADQLPSWVGTFHSLAARMLRMEPSLAGLRDNFQVLDADDSKRVLKRTMDALSMLTKRAEGVDPLKTVGNAISRLKDNLVHPDHAASAIEAWIAAAQAAGRRVDVDTLRLVATVYPAYQRELIETNSADYGDLLLWTTGAMLDDENTRRRFANLFAGIWVDEYQDISLALYYWLYLLAKDHRNIFVVGDDDQSIFSFRGSDIRYIRRFRNDYSDATVVRLEENFRSTGHILTAANAIIAGDRNRLGKTLYTNAGLGLPIQILEFDSPDEEAHAIVADMRRQNARGVPWGDMACLYRSSHISRAVEDALIRNSVGYVLVGDQAYYHKAEIKDALALLRLSLFPDDHASDDSCRRMLNTPMRGLGPKAEETIADHARATGRTMLQACEDPPLKRAQRQAAQMFAATIRLCAAQPGESLSDQLHRVLHNTGYLNHWRNARSDDAQSRVESLQEFVALTGSFPDAVTLFEHAALASARASDEDAKDRVTLMTIHAAKGLEFPLVYLPGWEDGILPSAKSVAQGLEAEERRLAYVAITRAKRLCTITHTRFRHGRPMEFSPYLSELPRHCYHPGWLGHVRLLR
ncbi:ATP-dependent helicase [Azospirillum canadense]|uniref:ATP-dependent helicase n=1 Tax=Azospirillum canadense TaxID=403962 RepID=UPI002226201E|nr:UvrD-helicase domain-containing protein [Azospirillum canadense]MCW2240734.1 DNA helicase-2/ATP-dependent DNA helicase PcrA [Azospirillum canadense]